MDFFLLKQVLQDLKKKMVFISGPRQVGKTTFSKLLFNHFSYPLYLNYDALEDRSVLDKRKWRNTTDLIILDEIHKKKGWKNYLKGIYDTKPKHLSILVTGSARLETFRKSGDSLTGRFFAIRMLPLSVKQLQNNNFNFAMETLLSNGGFPEPFYTNSEVDRDRWKNQYLDTMIREEVLDLERIHELNSLKHLVDLLRRRIGSPISYRSLSEDLSISPNTVKRYIDILESLYIIFRITPFYKKIQRSIQKEPKVYFFDWSLIQEEGPRLENFVAVHLLKHVYATNDFLGKQIELGYLRTKDGREIDFCIHNHDKILNAIEVKSSDYEASRNCKWFFNKFQIPVSQWVRFARQESQDQGIRIIPLEKALGELYY
jgi:hypothetical protein